MPSISGIADIIAKVSARKATGEDGVPIDVLKCSPYDAAKAVQPLLVKSCVFGAEPALWKGGIAHQLYKGKLDPS
eukprot:12423956-Alexandrium_andersonii.AAC.1